MNIMKDLELVMLDEKAKVPMRATVGSAGYDVFAAKEILLPKGKIVKVSLPFTFEGKLDGNVQVRLFVRSSFGLKKKVRLTEDGEKNIEGITLNLLDQVHTIELLNDSDADLVIAEGEHFAQFIISEKNPKKEKQTIEKLTKEELGDLIPTKGHMEEVEPNVYDYILDEEITFNPNEQKVFPTGLRTVIEEGTWTAIVTHEDLKGRLLLPNQTGIIDFDYSYNPTNFGCCFLGMVNLADQEITLPAGAKLTRWYTEKYYKLQDEIKTDTVRTGGIGHTTK